jgi:hypothetical protein
LKKGEHLKTDDGQDAAADGGSVPASRDGWMWHLTIQDDHDFYVEPADEGAAGGRSAMPTVLSQRIYYADGAGIQSSFTI